MSNTSAQCTLLRQSESSNVEAAPITREYLTLLSQNYENGSYAFCGGRIHVALLTKIISIGVIPFYALILTFMVHFGNATAIMFAIIILGSVAVTTIYGAFRGSKLCLVPFIFLQVVFFIYDLVLLGLFSIALLRSEKSASLVYTIYVTDSVSPQIVLLVTSIVLLCALVPILWIAYVVYLDILFIAELDRGLEFMRELNENASNDDVTPKLNNF
ncbi:hypothetical protein Y032_0516g2794 [Ancylostoma ceylanicum]|uniref:Uncharacterized protein n=1 Tax=Ancylostoma ceylanicum TaxID=53326 RepID=A0A016WT27_9BILA|nr:hypothetical protein Y032_0516g2794 [Ancylostoma ceylanicum]